MKTSFIPLLLILPFLVVSCSDQALKKEVQDAEFSDEIRINQLGYSPDYGKAFSVAGSDAEEFMLLDERRKVVYRGKLADKGRWEPSGEQLRTGDFRKFREEGSYSIFVPGNGLSYPFAIQKDLYNEAATASLRSFYFMRASMEMEEKYLGTFARPLGHPDDTCYFHPSSGHSKGFISSPGGWYDAGDYGKYIINASIATGTMLALYELFPGTFGDGSLNIPESGNGINDLLDEMRYEFEWVLTMQDTDGGVFHKLTPQWHDGITMPHETFSKRLIIGKSTAAALDFAAMLAQSSRVYNAVDPEFSKRCLEAARKAYLWALENPDSFFSRNPPDIGTGAYNDTILDEEFFWAAAELYVTTGEDLYFQAIEPVLGDIQFRLEESWRNYVDNLGYYSLYSSDRLSSAQREKLEAGILRLANELQEHSEVNPYGIPIERFVWGSNSDVLNTAIVQIYAYQITEDTTYLETAREITNYIFGRNATGYCFVSGFGSKPAENFHHRLLMADDNEACFPGFVAGGPNFQVQDSVALKKQGIAYPSLLPAKAYIDHSGSYASNEVCINWNAPLVFMLGALAEIEE